MAIPVFNDDGEINPNLKSELYRSVESGIMDCGMNNYFEPRAYISREEIAVLLLRLYDKILSEV